MTNRTLWGMWWAGSILVILSYGDLVPLWLAWIGFGVAGASTIISVVRHRAWRPPEG